MDCREVKTKYYAFLDDELSSSENEAFKEHLQHCGTCRTAYERFAAALETLPALRPANPNPFLFTRIEQQLDAPLQERVHTSPSLVRLVLRPVLVSVFILTAIGAGMLLGSRLNGNADNTENRPQLSGLADHYGMSNTESDVIETYYITEE